MAGLTLLLGLLAGAASQEVAAQEPAAPATIEAARIERHRVWLDRLRQWPRPEDPAWRAAVFHALRWLEFAPEEVALPGWESLAASGDDSDRANLLLYRRRHGLDLPPPAAGEGVESVLERALALWGRGRLQTAAAAFRAALERHPGEPRLLENLLWLEDRAPAPLAADASPRSLALAVLARRGGPF